MCVLAPTELLSVTMKVIVYAELTQHHCSDNTHIVCMKTIAIIQIYLQLVLPSMLCVSGRHYGKYAVV